MQCTKMIKFKQYQKGHFSDTKLITNFLRDSLDLNVAESKQILKITKDLMTFPYIYISSKQFKNVKETKIRLDLFGENAIMFKKF